MALSVVQDTVVEGGPGRAGELLSELLRSPEGWSHHVVPLVEGRAYTKLLDLPEADAWLILWAPGSQLELHDHGSSWASLAVVQGRLVERHRSRSSATLHRRALGRGDTVSFGPDHLHQVENPHPHTAASLHVYSPPLEQMTFPEADGPVRTPETPGWGEQRVGTVGR